MNRGIRGGVYTVALPPALHVIVKTAFVTYKRRKAHFRGGLCHRKLVGARKGRKMVMWMVNEVESGITHRTVRFPVLRF